MIWKVLRWIAAAGPMFLCHNRCIVSVHSCCRSGFKRWPVCFFCFLFHNTKIWRPAGQSFHVPRLGVLWVRLSEGQYGGDKNIAENSDRLQWKDMQNVGFSLKWYGKQENNTLTSTTRRKSHSKCCKIPNCTVSLGQHSFDKRTTLCVCIYQ